MGVHRAVGASERSLTPRLGRPGLLQQGAVPGHTHPPQRLHTDTSRAGPSPPLALVPAQGWGCSEHGGRREPGQNPPPPRTPGELPPVWCPAEAGEAPLIPSPGPWAKPLTQALHTEAAPRQPTACRAQSPLGDAAPEAPELPGPRDRGAKWPQIPSPMERVPAQHPSHLGPPAQEPPRAGPG